MNTVAKGTKHAKAVADHLAALGFTVARREWMDKGDDMTAVGHGLLLSVEAKNVRNYRFGDWIDQAAQQDRAFGSVPIVVAKRNGKGAVGESFVVLRLSDLKRLLGL